MALATSKAAAASSGVHTRSSSSRGLAAGCRPHTRQPRVVCGSAAARPPRWMKVVEAHEYSFYFGYNGAPAATSAAGQSTGPTAVLPPGNTAAAGQQVTQQQLAQEISSAADWPDLLQLSTEHVPLLTPALWLRLLFRLCVSLCEVDWSAAEMDSMLSDEMPPLLSAAATNLQGGTAGMQATATNSDHHHHHHEQQQQQFVSQLADMLYALAVLANTSHEDAAATVQGDSSSSSSSSSGGSSSTAGRWYQCGSMQQLLDAVARLGNSWNVDCISRKDAVSLLWAYGKLLQLQRGRQPDSSSSSSVGDTAGSLSSRQRFVSKLCSHIALLIQLSNNTADAATAPTPAGSSSSSPQPLLNPNHSSLTEPWHPDDLADAVTGLAAAAGDRSQSGPGFKGQTSAAAVTATATARFVDGQASTAAAAAAAGFKGQAAAELLDAAAHEVYRQLSNRHSTAGSFTVEGVVGLLQAFCELNYKDGPSLRMFDAAAGWVVKRVRARHMQAPSSPPQLAAVADVFARLQHRTVVVPELLNALGSQACKAAAAAVELAAADPWSYHAGGSSSSYCHWLPQHAATLLQAYLQLGYTPPAIVLDSVLTALMLHWEFEQSQIDQSQQQQRTEQSEQQELAGQQGGQAGQVEGVTGQHLEQQVAAVQLLGVLAQMCFHPGERVLPAITRQAWGQQPQEHLTLSQLLTLLFSSAQLAATLPTPAPATAATAGSNSNSNSSSSDTVEKVTAQESAVAAVADELILSTMPEHQHQQQQQERLDLPSLIRVLWALCVYGCLDIARYGWLLVAVAAGPWQRLNEDQLLVIKHGQVLLGQDGSDMASEVLPAQLLTRVEAAWTKWCQQHTAPALPSLSASLDGGSSSTRDSSSGSSDSAGSEAGLDDRSAKPRGVSAAWWKAHTQLAACLHSSSGRESSLSNNSNSGSTLRQQLLHAATGRGVRAQQIPLGDAAPSPGQAGHVLLGAFVLECMDFQQQQQQQAVGGALACQGLLQQASLVPMFIQGRVGSLSCSSSNGVEGSSVLLLVCADEAFSRGQAAPLGVAVLQARLALTLWQQQLLCAGEGDKEDFEESGHAAVAVPVYGMPLSSVTR